ncbi:MAG: sensor domain-containing diguanylate cyclase [Helicobacteraceae bacterium]|nr:sensor domain-containing diguanylate cyclase [Helicobacteraceae bacterium]
MASSPDVQTLQNEIVRLNKMVQALMNRAERSATFQGSDFNLFQTAITLEDEVHRRTKELNASLLQNEKMTRALRESENRSRLLIENTPMGIYEIDHKGKIVSINQAGLLLQGFKDESDLKGLSYLDTIGENDLETIEELLNNAFAGAGSNFEYKCVRSDRIFKSYLIPIQESDGPIENVMGIMEDITERKISEEQIRMLAFYDALTRLPNRRLFNERLEHAMIVSKRSGNYGTVMYMDLDNFKPLNDTHGHGVGDLLLIEVGRRLTRCVREMDTVSRFGGDEFVVMLTELNSDHGSSQVQAGVVAEKIRASLEEPFVLIHENNEGKEIIIEHFCTASIGVSMFINHDFTSEVILKRADAAMYQSKDNGRNRVSFYA